VWRGGGRGGSRRVVVVKGDIMRELMGWGRIRRWGRRAPRVGEGVCGWKGGRGSGGGYR